MVPVFDTSELPPKKGVNLDRESLISWVHPSCNAHGPDPNPHTRTRTRTYSTRRASRALASARYSIVVAVSLVVY